MERYDPYTDKFINDVSDINVGDMISRQQAIDAIISFFKLTDYNESAYAVKTVLGDLPSAQPEIVRCKDCNHFYKDSLNQWCFLGKYGVKENDFCSRAERSTDG